MNARFFFGIAVRMIFVCMIPNGSLRNRGVALRARRPTVYCRSGSAPAVDAFMYDAGEVPDCSHVP